MKSTASALAAKILKTVILADRASIQRELRQRIVPCQTLPCDEEERLELLDAVRERLLLISLDRRDHSAVDSAGFRACVRMLRHLACSQN
jgi:hypothetical protein